MSAQNDTLSSIPPLGPQDSLIRRETMQTRRGNPKFYQELKMRSLYADTHRDITDKSEIIPIHNHLFYELLHCESGQMAYLLDTRRCCIRPGDTVLIPPGCSHGPLPTEEFIAPYSRIVLWVHRSVIGLVQSLSPGLQFDKPLIVHGGSQAGEKLRAMFRAGCDEANVRRDGWQSYVFSNAVQLMILLHRLSQSQPAPLFDGLRRTLFDDIVYYVEQHLGEQMTLARAARHFSVCESTVSKLFRAQAGTGFYRYVTQRRINKAKSLIASGEPVQSAAQAVGYSDYSAFFRAFKKEIGLSPSHYMSAVKENTAWL